MVQIIQVLKQKWARLKQYFPLSFSDTYTILVNSVKAGCYYFRSAYKSRMLVRESAEFISKRPRIKEYYEENHTKQLQLVELRNKHFRDEYAEQVRQEIKEILTRDNE
jgi:hypothetical protein